MGIIKTEPIKTYDDILTARKKLVAKYDVNDSRGVEGNTLVDLSGNGNDGIMTNVQIVDDVQLGRKVLYFTNDPDERTTSFVTFKTSIVPLRHYVKTNLKPVYKNTRPMYLFQTLNDGYNSGEYGIALYVSTTGGNFSITYVSYYKQPNGSSPGANSLSSNSIVTQGSWAPVDIINNAMLNEKMIFKTLSTIKDYTPSDNKYVFKGHTQRFTLGCPYKASDSYYGYSGYVDTVEIYDLDAPAIYLICDNKKKLYTIQSGELVTLNITLDATESEIQNAIKTKGFTDTTQLINLMKSPSWDMSSFSLVMYDIIK